jgi:hypothetical protein
MAEPEYRRRIVDAELDELLAGVSAVALEVPTVGPRGLLTGERPPLAGRTQASLRRYAEESVASGFPAIRPLWAARSVRSWTATSTGITGRWDAPSSGPTR